MRLERRVCSRDARLVDSISAPIKLKHFGTVKEAFTSKTRRGIASRDARLATPDAPTPTLPGWYDL